MDPFGGLLGPQPTGNPYTFANTSKPVWQSTRLAQPKAPGPAMTAPPRTLGQMVQNKVAGAVAPVAGQRFANNLASLIDYSPVGAMTQGFQFGQDLRNSNVGGAVANGIGTALNVVPDGALGGAALHSIIAPLWHGSPHKFEQFALDKIGTGEGAQAYGHGLYFAENKNVAQDYQQQLSNGTLRGADGALIDPYNYGGNQKLAAQFLIDAKGDAEAAKRKAAELYAGPQPAAIGREIDALVNSGVAPSGSGHLYQVKLDANPEDFLDWDAPLSGQARPLLNNMAKAGTWPGATADDLAELGVSGQSAYQRMIAEKLGGPVLPGGGVRGFDADASKRLREAGIPGIRYLDQGSRGAGNGTRNYVVFDPSIIDITGRQ